MKIFNIVRKVQQVIAGGGNGFVASVVNAGVALSSRFTLVAGEAKPGIAVDTTRHTLRGATQAPAVQSSLLAATGSVRPASIPALALSAAPSALDPASTSKRPALSLVQSLRGWAASSIQKHPALATTLLGAQGQMQSESDVALSVSAVINQLNAPKTPAFTSRLASLTGTLRIGGSAVTETAIGGRTDWANDANAISGTNGIHDGVSASIVGNSIGARGGQLELAFPDHFSKERLRITSARLHFYGSVTGTSLNNADVQLRWDSGSGTFVTLETITGDANFLVTPKTHDITASFNGWAGFNGLRAAVSMASAALETYTANLDAIEIEIQYEYKYIEDTSGNERDGAVLGRSLPTVIASPRGAAFGNALDFDGVDRDDASTRVTSPNISPAGVTAMTLECSFRKDRSAVEIPCAWNNWNGAALDGVQLAQQGGNFYQLQVFIAGVFTVAINTLAAVSNGSHTMAAAWDGANIYFFLDGVLQGSAALTSFPTVPMKVWAGAIDWRQGVAAAWPYPADGAIDEVRLSNVCRYTSTYTPATAPFTPDANTMLLWSMEAILP